jgi:hypothetical protein
MSNVFTKIGDGIKDVAVDVAHGVEEVFTVAGKVEKVLATALSSEGDLKAGIVQVVALGEKVVADGAVDWSAKGLNLISDAQTVADVQALFSYLQSTFFPLVTKVYGEVVADVKQ